MYNELSVLIYSHMIIHFIASQRFFRQVKFGSYIGQVPLLMPTTKFSDKTGPPLSLYTMLFSHFILMNFFI